MFTAIVLDNKSQDVIRKLASDLLLVSYAAKIHCHHVTLAMGDASARFAVGTVRKLRVTHYAENGRVTALRVSGAEDSSNKVPHVTFATFNSGKPKESNDLTGWIALDGDEAKIEISGKIEICH